MFRWTHIPLVRITAIFCSGILLGIYQFESIEFRYALVGAIVSLGLYGAAYALKERLRYFKNFTGPFGMAFLFLTGYLLVLVKTESRNPLNILHARSPILAYEAVVEGHLEEKKSSFKTTVEVHRIKTKTGWAAASGKINLYISKKTYTMNLNWGNEIIVLGEPRLLQPPANPHEFDFRRFLTFKNIYHQQFIQGDDYRLTGRTEKGFFHYSSKARNYFTSIIKKYVKGDQEQAISLALVIGVTDGIDNELINAYSASGAMHVLAVSGLHVGIIYWMILLILKPIQRKKNGLWIVAGISLIILWSYSFVTGLSPSVLRAVTMFSFVAISKPLSIRSNIFNTLAGSALILLSWNPYLIMSVGFQLSYLAVLGIIWIQRPLYQLYVAKTWLTDQIWKITCVSIAAQATTFSLGLLYFHQFPTYFLVSNLFVIPVSFAVLVVGIVLIVVSAIEPVANVMGFILHWLSWLLNEGVFLVEDWPLSIINNIYIDLFQSWLIMGIVTSLILIFQLKKLSWLYVGLSLSLVFSVTQWIHYVDRSANRALYVFNVSGESVFEIVDNGRSSLVADSTFLTDQERIRFHIRPNRLYNLVEQTNNFNGTQIPGKGCRLLKYSGKTILFICKPINKLPEDVEADFVVIGSDAAWKSPDIISKFAKAKIILDSSWGNGQLKWLKKQLGDWRPNVYPVPERGAFIAEL
jgi:competence protein ComEC